MHKFQFYKDRRGDYRVRFMYNSEVIFSTEGYTSKVSAKNALASLLKNAPDAPILDKSEGGSGGGIPIKL